MFSDGIRMWPTLENSKTWFFTEPTLTKCGLHKTLTMGSFPLMENLALTMPFCHWLSLDSLAFKSLPNKLFPLARKYLNLLLKDSSDLVSVAQDNGKCCQFTEQCLGGLYHTKPFCLDLHPVAKKFYCQTQWDLMWGLWCQTAVTSSHFHTTGAWQWLLFWEVKQRLGAKGASFTLSCFEHFQTHDYVSFQAEEHAETAGGERCRLWGDQKESGFHSVVTRGSLPWWNKVDYRIKVFWNPKLIIRHFHYRSSCVLVHFMLIIVLISSSRLLSYTRQ